MTYYDLTPDQRRLASALHRGVELLVAGCLDVQRSVEDRLLDVRAGFALFATAGRARAPGRSAAGPSARE